MGFGTVLLILSIISILITTSTSQPFKCTSGSTCHALIDYVPPNSTTLSAVKTLFGVKNLRTILGVNNYPLSTSPNETVAAKQKIKIPFPCICINGTGISNKRPVYTVQKDDGLYHIAAEIFSGLMMYQQIQTVNNISNPDLIMVGQKLWIPLPCSCNAVDGLEVVHYGHVVEAGSSVEKIAEEYGTTEDTLLRVNGMTNPTSLLAGAVLDVPLRACTSMIKNESLDSPLLVSNGTYVFTANNCVKCNCDSANNWTLQCEPSQIKPSDWATCPSMQCDGTSSLYIGNVTSSTACNRVTCAYAGYFSNQTILTDTTTESTCTVSDNNAPKIDLSWSFIFISLHLVVLCLHLFH